MSNLDDMIADITNRRPYRLASEADCAEPDSPDSAGSEFLEAAAHGVIDAVESKRSELGADLDDLQRFLECPSEWLPELIDCAVPTCTARLWAAFVDLAAYHEDPSEYAEAGEMNAQAIMCLYIIGDRLAGSLLCDLAYAVEDDISERDEAEADEQADDETAEEV